MKVAVAIAVAMLAAAGAKAAPVMSGFAAVVERGGETVDLRGVGWGQTGRFDAPALGMRGTFKRSAETSGRGEVDYTGSLDFTLSADGSKATEGRCRYFQGTSEFRDRPSRDLRIDTSVLALPFRYHCSFLRGGREIGALTLQRAPGATIDLRTLRRGEITLGDARLDLRSVHTFEGSRMPAEMPLGYLMASADGDIGAAYINGGARRLVLPKSGEEREAALLASLALALLWDPGDGT